MRAVLPVTLLLVTLLLSVPAAAQSVRAGIDAWQQGKHAAAVAIWRPLAARGDADAMFNMGQAYKLGRGAPLDLGRAQSFYQQAAARGHVEAQATLGLMLFQNNDRPAALRWLKAAAQAGEPRAQLIYGTALFNGDGVPKDVVRAYALVSRAAAQGLAPAKATLAEMERLIPPAQRQQGLAQARQLGGPAKAARPAGTGSGGAAPTPGAATARSAAPPSGTWRIQLGAFAQQGAAEALYARYAASLRRPMVLVPSGSMTRLQAGPYTTRAEAAAACRMLAARGQACFPVPAR